MIIFLLQVLKVLMFEGLHFTVSNLSDISSIKTRTKNVYVMYLRNLISSTPLTDGTEYIQTRNNFNVLHIVLFHLNIVDYMMCYRVT